MGLQAEVGRHEPRLALDGGVDGMDDLLHLCRGAALMLRPGGYFAFEVLHFRHLRTACFNSLPPSLPPLLSLYYFVVTHIISFLADKWWRAEQVSFRLHGKRTKRNFFQC